MRIDVFSTKEYDRAFLEAENASAGHDTRFLAPRLNAETAALADGADAVCVFVNDTVDRSVIERLAAGGVRLIALRCAGFNNVDLDAAAEMGIAVCRVPAYSPHAVAEHTVAIILTLNRKIHRSWMRVREGNFELDGLLGFNLHTKTVGIVGTGQIGSVLAGLLLGFGCRVLAHDPVPDAALAARGVIFCSALEELLGASDVVSLQCPLTPETHHMIDARAVAATKPGALLIHTSRGAIIDTRAVIKGLKDGQIGGLGIDVYEEEGDLFFEDLSNHIIPDDVFARLLTFPNVLVTGHQAFFTVEALTEIARTTIANVTAFQRDGAPVHPVPAPAAPATASGQATQTG
ncbi:MAG: 2-hydroxyacid dehydrogenase [Pseudomonadota bacterium]